jgi:hypothetical protein
MDILSQIQGELNAPKNQRNNFGKYNYRSCEDILTGLKSLIKKYNVSVVLSDSIKIVGERIYVEATAKLLQDQKILGESKAFAREPLQQKGMNEAQVTGSASSYARKYALNGLFAIDDNKDSDTDEHQNNKDNRPSEPIIPVADQVRNYLRSGLIPVEDLAKYKADLNSKKIKPDQVLLNKLVGLYGAIK